MSKSQVDVYCYNVKRELVAKIDAGELTQEQIIEGGFNSSTLCKPEVMKAVMQGKGRQVASTIKYVFVSISNIVEQELPETSVA